MPRQQPGRRWKMGGLMAFAVSRLVAAQNEAPELGFQEDDFRIPMWSSSYEVRGGLGYKDNVTLSSSENAEASGFWLSRAEIMFFRLPSRGWQFNFFATADDVRYFDAESVDNEQVAMAVAQLNKDFGHDWKSTLGLTYLFQNQVFDMSATYTNGGSIGQVQGHMLSPRLGGRKSFGPGYVELELSAARQILAEPLDSYWQMGPKLAVGWNYGRGSEISLAYSWAFLDYDSREQSDLAGAPQTNTVLALQSHAVELAWMHCFDEQRHWQTTTRLGFESTHDNGSGYYDYVVYRAQEQVRYRATSWEVAAQAGVGFYDYAHQTVSTTDSSPRQRMLITFSLRAEKKLTKHLKVHASYALDRSLSDMEFDDYLANTVLGGLGVEF